MRNAGTVTRFLAVPAALIACLAIPSAASADSFSQLYQSYSTSGSIPGCQYSSGQLNSALGQIPADVQNYDPGFGDALNNALGASCSSGGGTQVTSAGIPLVPGAGPIPPGLAGKAGKAGKGHGPPHPVAPYRKVGVPAGARPAFSAPRKVPIPAALTGLGTAVLLIVGAMALAALFQYMGWSLRNGKRRRGRSRGRRVGAAAIGLRSFLP